METSDERVDITMRDIDRLKIIHEVLKGHLRQGQAAQQLNLGRRQVIRLCRRVQQEGNRGIVHRHRGRASNHQVDPTVLEQALSALHDNRYDGFGPTLANEKLKLFYDLKVSTSALRAVMLQTELWSSRTYAVKHRAWRPRRSCVGELVQLDGSDHDWFEGRGPRCVLILYIDDATSRLLYAEFVDVEDTLTLLATTQTYLNRHGRPIAFYVDKDSIYTVNRQASIEEELKDSEPITQFTRAMTELGIDVICANSPQAKGRVERSFGTHQDRLVKELRLAGISTKAAANHYLWNTYLPAHDARFAVAPANTTNAHRPLLQIHRLNEILSIRTDRVLAQDFTLRFQHHFFQLLPDQPLRIRPRADVTVELRLDGSFHLRFKDHYLAFKILSHKPARIPVHKKQKQNPLPIGSGIPPPDSKYRLFRSWNPKPKIMPTTSFCKRAPSQPQPEALQHQPQASSDTLRIVNFKNPAAAGTSTTTSRCDTSIKRYV